MRDVQDMTEKEARHYESVLWNRYYQSFPLTDYQSIMDLRQLYRLLQQVQRRRKQLRVRNGLARV